MKSCPFCGASDNLKPTLLRMVCLDCGASGPTSEDPEAAWEMRAEVDESAVDYALDLWLQEEWFPPIHVDGSADSVRWALNTIFARARRKQR